MIISREKVSFKALAIKIITKVTRITILIPAEKVLSNHLIVEALQCYNNKMLEVELLVEEVAM